MVSRLARLLCPWRHAQLVSGVAHGMLPSATLLSELDGDASGVRAARQQASLV